MASTKYESKVAPVSDEKGKEALVKRGSGDSGGGEDGGDKKPGKAANAAGPAATGNHFPAGAKCVINPRNEYMKKWDVVMLVLLLFTATVTPYEVGFLPTEINFLFVLNRLVDFLFLKDMVMNFFLASLDLEAGFWVIAHSEIARRYLRGWFIIDLVSILPFDTISVAMDSNVVEKLRIFRIIRLFRLFKLLRIFRASRIFARWEAYISVSYSWLSLIKFMVAVLSVSHWLACFYRMVPDIEVVVDANGDPLNWMTEYAYISDRGSEIEFYITSLYWSVMTLTTIGYGDVNPATHGERVLALIAMMIGGSIYAYVIGAVCGIVASMDEATTLYHKTMDELNLYMEENKLPQDLRRRLREYFNNCRALQRASHYRDLLTKMSPMLRGEVAVAVNGDWIGELPFLQGTPRSEREGFTTEVALRMNIEAFAPNESVVKVGQAADKMYIVQRGVVSMLGRVYRSGDILGDDMILTNATRNYAVRALTFTALSTLSKDDFDDILTSGLFPETQKIVRMCAIRMSVRREFIHYANSIMALRSVIPSFNGKAPKDVRAVLAESTDLELPNAAAMSPLLMDAGGRKGSASSGEGAGAVGGGAVLVKAGSARSLMSGGGGSGMGMGSGLGMVMGGGLGFGVGGAAGAFGTGAANAPPGGALAIAQAQAAAAGVTLGVGAAAGGDSAAAAGGGGVVGVGAGAGIAGSPHMPASGSGGGPMILGKSGSRRVGVAEAAGSGAADGGAGTVVQLGAGASPSSGGAPPSAAATAAGAATGVASGVGADASGKPPDSELRRVIADAERELGLPTDMQMPDDMDFDLVGDLGNLTDDATGSGVGGRASPAAVAGGAVSLPGYVPRGAAAMALSAPSDRVAYGGVGRGGVAPGLGSVVQGPVEVDEKSPFAAAVIARGRAVEASVAASRTALAEKLDEVLRRVSALEYAAADAASYTKGMSVSPVQGVLIGLLVVQAILVIVVLAIH